MNYELRQRGSRSRLRVPLIVHGMGAFSAPLWREKSLRANCRVSQRVTGGGEKYLKIFVVFVWSE